jgi:hypothetical protein
VSPPLGDEQHEERDGDDRDDGPCEADPGEPVRAGRQADGGENRPRDDRGEDERGSTGARRRLQRESSFPG